MAKEKADGGNREAWVKRAIAGRAFDESIELSREIGDSVENTLLPARGVPASTKKVDLDAGS